MGFNTKTWSNFGWFGVPPFKEEPHCVYIYTHKYWHWGSVPGLNGQLVARWSHENRTSTGSWVVKFGYQFHQFHQFLVTPHCHESLPRPAGTHRPLCALWWAVPWLELGIIFPRMAWTWGWPPFSDTYVTYHIFYHIMFPEIFICFSYLSCSWFHRIGWWENFTWKPYIWW